VSASQAVILVGNLLHSRASEHLTGYTFTTVLYVYCFKIWPELVFQVGSIQGIIDLVARDLRTVFLDEILVLSPQMASTLPWIII